MFLKAPFLQEKFFTVIKGEANIYCLNIEKTKDYFCFNMIPEKGLSLYVPKGWATGIHSIIEESIIYYSSNQIYKPEFQININYKVIPELRDKNLLISEKDS